MKKSLFGAAALLGLAVLAGCAKPSIVGKWEGTTQAGQMSMQTELEFTKDGKVNMTAKTPMGSLPINGAYTDAGDKVTMNLTLPPAIQMMAKGVSPGGTKTYKIEGDKLTLGETTYTRVKK